MDEKQNDQVQVADSVHPVDYSQTNAPLIYNSVQPTVFVPPAKRSKKPLVLIFIVIVVIGAAAVFGYLHFFSPKNSNGITGSVAHLTSNVIVGEVIKNNYRVYKQPTSSSRQQTTTFTLADESGKKIKEATSSSSLEMVTPVGSGQFLFKDNGNVGNKPYWVFDKDGFRQLSTMPASMMDQTDSSQGKPRGLTSFGENTVAYAYCNSKTLQCDLRSVDLITGKEKTMILPDEIKEYGGGLLSCGSDKKTAYFMGVSKANAATFQKESDKITGGGIHFENDPEVQGVYELKITQSILKLDLSSNKVVSNKPVVTEYTYYQKFWLSPNGEHLVYSNGGESGQLHYVSVADGKTSMISLPSAGQSTEPWSGETTTYDPLFSDEGDYMAYVTYDTSTGKFISSVGVIDFKTKTAKEYAKEPADTPAANNGALASNYFENMRWAKPTQFEMTAGTDNYQFNTATASATKLEKSLGLLVGIADGER